MTNSKYSALWRRYIDQDSYLGTWYKTLIIFDIISVYRKKHLKESTTVSLPD